MGSNNVFVICPFEIRFGFLSVPNGIIYELKIYKNVIVIVNYTIEKRTRDSVKNTSL